MNARSRAWLLASLLASVLVALLVAGLNVGASDVLRPGDALRGLGARLGLCAPLTGSAQPIAELRLWRALVASGVGAALGLSGALLQGVFRNPLASPSVIGVSAGASLGAALSILALGGYGPTLVVGSAASIGPWVVVAGAFLAALGTTWLVLRLATHGGRLSVPALLLVGIAVNTCIAGALATVQFLTLYDFEIARAILTWTFGTLDDRSGAHAAMVWTGLALALVAVPFVDRELDLYGGGEDDARALGVDVRRLKRVGLATAALAAAVATSVAGQISFVGLVVPHLVRLVTGSSHRSLLPLSALGGAVFLLGADLLQQWLLGGFSLQPGVVMSLIGGPFFLFLLWRQRAVVRSW